MLAVNICDTRFLVLYPLFLLFPFILLCLSYVCIFLLSYLTFLFFIFLYSLFRLMPASFIPLYLNNFSFSLSLHSSILFCFLYELLFACVLIFFFLFLGLSLCLLFSFLCISFYVTVILLCFISCSISAAWTLCYSSFHPSLSFDFH